MRFAVCSLRFAVAVAVLGGSFFGSFFFWFLPLIFLLHPFFLVLHSCVAPWRKCAHLLNTVYPGSRYIQASKVEQLIENIGALHVATKLTPDVMGAIDQALGNKPVDKEKDFLRSSMAGNFPDQY